MNPGPTIATNPTALDLDAMLTIHRHRDGRIALSRKVDGTMHNLWCVTPDELRGMLRPLADYLARNSYFSLNALYRPGWMDEATGLHVVGVDKNRPIGERRYGRVTENLRYLNACYCDVDCNRSASEAKHPLELLSLRDAQRRVEDLQDAGIIPPFSIMGHSGRGLYVLWLLHDDRDPTQSAPAFNWHIPVWKAIQSQLADKLDAAPLPVDRAGSLITQVYKIPGCIDTKSGNRVRYFVYMQGDQDKRLITYTLQDMAARLSIPAPGGDLPAATQAQAKPATFKRTKKTGSARNRSYSYKRLNALRARDLLTLQNWRGGWRKRGEPYANGHRSPVFGRLRMLDLYARVLIGSMFTPTELPDGTLDAGTLADVQGKLREMAAACVPPYPSDSNDVDVTTILDAILSEYRRGPNGERRRVTPPLKNVTICAALGITADVARELKLETIRPAGYDRDDLQARPTQAEIVNERRAWLEEYIMARGAPRSARSLARVYSAKGFTGANHQTANQDLNALGYVVRRSTGGRPRRAAKVVE